jgi:ABC-2 type transport system permease protein
MHSNILTTIKDSFQIASKDLKDFTRDRMQLIFFIIMPVFMMMMIGFIYPSENSLKDIPLGIANQDQGQVSKTLVQVFSDMKVSSGDKVFTITTYSDNEAIKKAIKDQKINGGIYIPADFSQNVKQNKKAELSIIPDQSNPQISAILTQMIQQVISGTSSGLAQIKVGEIFKLTSTVNPQVASLDTATIIQPIQSKIDNIIPGKSNYFQFIAPGIMAMIVMMSVMTGLAVSISQEKQSGTMDGLLIAPISRLSIILGKAFAQTARGMIQGMIVLLLAISVFGVHVYGNWLVMILLMFLGVFAFMGVGILVSTIATAQETAMTIMMTFQLPMMFLSGIFFPIQQMPQVMQYISKAIPLTYEATSLRKIIVLGAGLSSVWTEVLILSIVGLVMISVAVPTFKKIINR